MIGESPKSRAPASDEKPGLLMSRRGWGLGERDTCPIHYSSRVRVQCGYMTRRIKPGSLRVHFPAWRRPMPCAEVTGLDSLAAKH